MLRRMIARHLIQSLNPELSQRFDEQLENRSLAIGLEPDLHVSEPLDILDDRVHRESLLVNAFLRDHMPEHCLALAVPHNKDLDRALLSRILLLARDLPLVADSNDTVEALRALC